jgi:hypothetical protein
VPVLAGEDRNGAGAPSTRGTLRGVGDDDRKQDDDDRKGERRSGDEDEKERRDRELIELLNELRVVLPGVQVLFAFLLTVPFSNGYSKMTDLQRDVYFLAFLATTVATLLLIAPSTYHRIMFRRGDKEQMLFTSNRLAIAGTAFLAVAMAAVVFEISDVLFGVGAASVLAGVATLAIASLWYILPLSRRIAETRREREGERRP